LIRQICIIRVLITSSPLMYFEQNIRTRDDKHSLRKQQWTMDCGLKATNQKLWA